MTQVSKATDEDVARYYSGAAITGEWIGYTARRDRRVLAVGGLIRMENDEWMGFLDMPIGIRSPLALRYAVKLLREAKERGAKSIVATCDEAIPRADAFLKRLGFESTDREFEGRTVWKWHN